MNIDFTQNAELLIASDDTQEAVLLKLLGRMRPIITQVTTTADEGKRKTVLTIGFETIPGSLPVPKTPQEHIEDVMKASFGRGCG